MINIKQSDFEKHMKNAVRLIEFENKLWELCGEAYKSSMDCELTFPTLIDDVVALLSAATEDKDEWISYYLFELDCGKKYEDGMIKNADGSNIKLRTIQDLWNLLVEE